MAVSVNIEARDTLLPCTITIIGRHNHCTRPVTDAGDLAQSSESTEKFFDYFDPGKLHVQMTVIIQGSNPISRSLLSDP